MRLTLQPCTLKAARRYVGEHHRHSLPPTGALFATSVVDELGELHGVGIAARPVARGLDDGRTVELVRVCTDGAANACSMLYGALARAARALGYTRAVTYTLVHEHGSSLKAAGFELDGEVAGRSWSTPARPRFDADLFGESPTCSTVGKVRWSRRL